jgi:hypothetical protein
MNLKKLHTLFIALVAGQILFCGVVLYLILVEDFAGVEMQVRDQYLAPSILLVAAAGTAYALNQVLSRRGRRLQFLATKVQQYSIASIVRLAIIEGANLLILIITLLSGQVNSLLFFALGMLVFLYFRPSLEDFVQSFELSAEEEGQLL